MTVHRYINGCKKHLKINEFGTHFESEVTCEDCLKINSKKEIKMSESKYPLIEKFLPNLKESVNFRHSVSASDLEDELAKGILRYGLDNFATAGHQSRNDTHVGLLIGYQLIENKEPVSERELAESLKEVTANIKFRDYECAETALDNLIKRIEKNGLEK